MSGVEVPLEGGQMTPGIVRIDNTVRRPVTEGFPFRHRLLLLLEERGCSCAPRFLGLDEQGREILSYIDGEVVRDAYSYNDVALAKVASMLREIHDATAESELARGSEVVCHFDIAPWNTVSVNGVPVGFIDFDAAQPGFRLDDIAYMVWTFLDLGSDPDLDRVQTRLRVMVDSYGLQSRAGLAQAILNQQDRVLGWRASLAEHGETETLRNASTARVKLISEQIKWVERNVSLIEST